MKNSIQAITALFAFFLLISADGCHDEPSTDRIQAQKTEQALAEADRQIGLPNISNFQERKLMKMVFELRDQEDLKTYTYTHALDGSLVFQFESIGFGIPASTQFTNPEKLSYQGTHWGYQKLPQADPNGLFMPTSSDATWIMMSTPDGPKVVYMEPKICVTTYKL